MSETFSVYQFFADDSYEKVREGVPAEEAVETAIAMSTRVRILEVHSTLVGIAHTLRGMNDFDHAQDMSTAALHCRAAYNDLRPRKEVPL